MGNDRLISISDVAEALGVSKTTVSRAISGNGRIGNETKARVKRYIEEHSAGNVPAGRDMGASVQTEREKTNNIGIVAPDDHAFMELPYFQNCLNGICENASAFGYGTMITMVSDNRLTQLERMIEGRKVDGVIVTRAHEKDEAIGLLSGSGLPFVVIGSVKDPDIYQIDNDHKMACRELTSLLLMKGVSKPVLIISGRIDNTTARRIEGFRGALENYGSFSAEETVRNVGAAEAELDRVIADAAKGRYDCMICADDVICVNVIEKLTAMGIRIPEDMLIASFSNSSVLERNIPSVTTLQFDARKLGLTACKTLLSLIEGRKTLRTQLLGYEILMKDSTKRN